MNIIELDINKLIPYENNAKIHTKDQIDRIAKSITLTKGLRQPIVIDKNNVIVCGHGRYMAAKQLGYEVVPCELVDDLTEDEIKAYRLIDNRISESEYDLSLEMSELEEIDIDMSDFGFEMFSIDDIEEIQPRITSEKHSETYEKVFVFPYSVKEKVSKYLNKHQAEIIEKIIKESEEEYGKL